MVMISEAMKYCMNMLCTAIESSTRYQYEAALREQDMKLDKREEVWIRAWCAVAADSACRRPDVAAGWADQCVEAFDENFSD